MVLILKQLEKFALIMELFQTLRKAQEEEKDYLKQTDRDNVSFVNEHTLGMINLEV